VIAPDVEKTMPQTIQAREKANTFDATLYQAADTARVKQAMRSMAGGVCVVTAGIGGERTGATVTSATALSMDPPTMIININLASSTWPIIDRYRHFCVNILSDRQRPVAERFSGFGGIKGVARYEGAAWTQLLSGAPVLEDALANIDCDVDQVLERRSHAIILGRILSVRSGAGQPLVYNNGRYGIFDPLS
jgi:flavin reductase (DIM6/NTAB) family NADH-FMN oxidoreductase RutF